MVDVSKPLSPEQRERGRKFRAVWDTLTPEEKRAVGAKYFTTDYEHVGYPVEEDDEDYEFIEYPPVKSGEQKLSKAGYSLNKIGELIELIVHPNCWTEEEWQEFEEQRRKSSPS